MSEKDTAYVAVVAVGGGCTIGIAKRDEPGYYRTTYGRVATMEEAQAWADEANKRLGLTDEEAIDIVTSSMRAQNLGGRGR